MSILDEIKLLNVLSESEKEKLSLFCQEKYLNAGEVLFNEQDEASAMYLLKE
jgi:CRP-like cAMP-binding protein